MLRSQIGEGFDSTEEHGIILAASLADRGLRQGRAVGLAACGKELIWLPPKAFRELSGSISCALWRQPPVASAHWKKSLASQKYELRRGASLVVITSDVSAGWIKPLIQLTYGRGDAHRAAV